MFFQRFEIIDLKFDLTYTCYLYMFMFMYLQLRSYEQIRAVVLIQRVRRVTRAFYFVPFEIR